jgi:hypothetical protein
MSNRKRWIVEVGNKQNGVIVSTRYFDSKRAALAAYMRAVERHSRHPLLEVRMWHTDMQAAS